MSGTLRPISGLGAKGPACFLVETPDARLLLDLGYGPQPGLWPDVAAVGAVDALLLSHSHADHAGGLKLLPQVGSPRVHASDIVRRTLPRGIASKVLPLHGSTDVCGIRISTGRNGHAPGGIWLHLEVGGGLLYMGDFSVESMLYAFDAPPPASTLIVDASYGSYDVALADCLSAFDRLFDAPPVLFPVPAMGRGPEIALRLARSGRSLPYLDDAIRGSLENFLAASAACVRGGVENDIKRIAREAPAIERSEGVMLAAGGDAGSGAAAKLVSQWENETTPAIVFTGYLPPQTPAERLTQSGRARYMRWNVHPRLSDNARLVRETRALRVLPAFGDARQLAAWQTAFAPAQVILEGAVTL